MINKENGSVLFFLGTLIDIYPSGVYYEGRKKEAGKMEEKCCCKRKKIRDPKEEKDLINRLNRIEGQIRGIRTMLENDAYCMDIINQVSAASSALNSFTKVLLSQHIQSCVVEDVQQGNQEKLEELINALPKLMK